MDKINYNKVSNNPKVIELIKERERIESEIKKLDETALINYELEILNL